VEALGIYLDGNEIKLAHVRKSKTFMEILKCERVLLQRAAEEMQEEEQEEETSFDEIFSGDEDIDISSVSPEQASEGDTNILFNTLARYPQQNLSIGMNTLESEVSFIDIVADFTQLKQKEIKKKIKEELEKFSGDVIKENYDCIVKKNNECTAFYHDNQLSLLQKILQIKETTKSNVKISLVDANEVSLFNLYANLVGEGTSILVYVGNQFSRILFMEDRQLLRISQLINEGCHSKNLHASLYAKLLFELDTLDIEEISNIYITGEGDLAELEAFLKEKIPEGVIKHLPFNKKFRAMGEIEESGLDGYAIPLAIAWKILAGKDTGFVDTNFLPADIKKQQEAFRLAWHGYLMLAVLFFATFFFVVQWHQFSARRDTAAKEIDLKENELVTEREITEKIVEMDNEIARYTGIMMLADSLSASGTMFSDALRYMSNTIRRTNSIWINDFILREKDFRISGKSLYRQRIHILSERTGTSIIESMDEENIRGKTIYKYELSGDPWGFLSPNKLITGKVDTLLHGSKAKASGKK